MTEKTGKFTNKIMFHEPVLASKTHSFKQTHWKLSEEC